MDSDADGVPDYRDLDSDGDGILDSIEDDGCSGTSPCTPTDTDGDGIPNYLDVDTDGDGKLDSVEKGPGATPMDSDRDGIPDYRDVDNLGNADVNVTNINSAVTGNLKTNDEVPVGTTYKQPAANANNPAGAILVVNADGTYSFTATKPGKYIYFVPVCGPNQTNGCPLSPLEITVLDPINIDKPVTNNDFAIILQGTPINLNVLANDQAGDPSKILDPSSLTIVTNPLHGTVIVNNNGSITYTPNAYFVGTDSLVYQVCDNNSPAQCQTAITYFKIEATGSTPVTTASDDYISTVASATTANTVSGTVLLNDQNSGGGILTATLISGPSSAQGTLVFNSDGTYSFTPSAGFVGPINIVYEVCGGSPVDCAKATLHVLVNPAPTLTNDAATAYVNIPTSGNISTNDVVPTGTTYSQPAALTGATIVVNANGTYSFTATTAGTYTYTVPVCAPGQTNNCPTETLVIVVPINTLVDDNATVEINTDLAGNISSNDIFPVGTTYGQPAQLTGATISVNANGTYTFTAISAGTYTYTIPVCAPGQTTNCPTESLVITVTSPAPPLPVPPTPPITSIVNPDFGVTNKSVPLTGNLSTNDVVSSGTTYGQPSANPANPAGGVITVSPNGTYTFTATVPGKYTYYVPTCAPGQTTGCPLTPLDITVVDPSIINNPPAINNDFAKTTVNTPVVINVLANDKATNKGGVISIGTAIVKVDPVHCTAIFNADGTLTYTPAPNFVGTDSLTYQICDNSNPANCQTALVYITVAASTESPTTIANDDFINSLYGASSAGNVLLNDINTGILNTSNALTASLVAGPTAAQGSFTMNADGTYTFTPTAGFSGPLDIVYKVCGGTPNTCANATLHILVAPQDPPVISPDFGVTNKSVPLTGNLNTNDQVALGTTYGQPASNSLNPSGASIVVNPNGSYTFNATNPGTYTYYVPTCAPAQTTGCPLSPLVITVTDPLISNNPPIANLDLVVTKSNTPVTTDVLANDKAGNIGSVLNISSLSISSQPKHGTVVVNPNGTLSYTPTSGFVGTDSLVYSICDNTSPTPNCKTATVYYTVNASNSAPATIASDDFAKAIAGSQISGNVLNNDNNTAGSTLAVTSNTSVPASKGVFTMNPNGTYSFTPAPGFTGPIDIIYTVCGGTPSICTNATLHLLIEPMIIPTILDVTKVAGSVIMNLDASFDVSFTIKVKNLSSQFIDSVLLKDDLSKVFTDTRGVKVVSVTTSGGLVRNANYDGISNIDLLSISSVLDPNKVDSVILRVNVSNNTSGTFQNTAIASAPTIYGISTSVSTDPTTDTNLSDSTKKPTVFIIPKVDLIVPEGFSPNNDGIDDTWIIQKPFGSKVEVRVFNRWGNEVFASTDYKNDWRGKATSNFLGEDLSEGTYYYIVIGTDISGKQLKLAGNLTIKR